MALAYMSGCHKGAMTARSLLSGQEKSITYQIEMQNQFNGVGLVWNILRRYVPEVIVGAIMGMRGMADQKGAVFDIPEDKATQFEDIFTHAKESGTRMDFEISKCKTLPELYESGGGM